MQSEGEYNNMSLQNRLDEKLLRDILIKLPVKSLMRFKCVSKRWQSFIQDSSFIKSHLSRSKTHPPQLLITSWNGNSKLIHSAGNEFKGGEAEHKVTIPWSGEVGILKQSIDGLFCFVDDSYCLTRIYNLGTRQVTAWAQSCIPIQGGESVKHKAIYGFGFDPLTKKYKLLRVWEICRVGYEYSKGRRDHICEVFTVGENQWRKIDEVPPARLHGGAGVYANSSVYWRNAGANGFATPDNEVIVAFDVGTEKFRVVEIPDFITCSPDPKRKYCRWLAKELLQIDGHIALLDTADADDYVVKLWISGDDGYRENKMTTNWTDETIALPFTYKKGHRLDVHPVQGTDEIVISSNFSDDRFPNERGPTEFVSLYIYNRTVKRFRKIDITGISPLSRPYGFNIYIFHESLLPVNQKPAAEEIPDQTSSYTTGLRIEEDTSQIVDPMDIDFY